MSEEMKTYTEEEVELSYEGRCISDRKELGMAYCGSCSIDTHRSQLANKRSWVHSSVKSWIKEASKESRQPDTKLVEPCPFADQKPECDRVKLCCVEKLADKDTEIEALRLENAGFLHHMHDMQREGLEIINRLRKEVEELKNAKG